MKELYVDKPPADKMTEEKKYGAYSIRAAANLHALAAETAGKYLRDKQAFILDLGAGEGAFCARLKDAGFRNLEACELEAGRFQCPDVVSRQVDLNIQDFHRQFDKKYGGIMALEILEHLENPSGFFRNASQMLLPGGYLIVSTPNVTSWYSRLSFLREGRLHWFNLDRHEKDGHISPIFDWQIAVLTQACGMRIVESLQTDGRLMLRKYLYPRGKIAALARPMTWLYFLLRVLMKGPSEGELRLWVLQKA